MTGIFLLSNDFGNRFRCFWSSTPSQSHIRKVHKHIIIHSDPCPNLASPNCPPQTVLKFDTLVASKELIRFFAAQRLKLWASKRVWPVLFYVPMAYGHRNIKTWPCFHQNEWIKWNKIKHFCYSFTYRVELCTFSAFIVVGLHDLSMCHRLQKHISGESKFQLPNP